MKIHIGWSYLYVIFRPAANERDPLGFKIKLKKNRLYSERNGHRRGFCLGPFWIGAYARKI